MFCVQWRVDDVPPTGPGAAAFSTTVLAKKANASCLPYLMVSFYFDQQNAIKIKKQNEIFLT